MSRRRPPAVELTIHDLAATGEGVARLPTGDAVFVPGALPGEAVRVELGEGRPRRSVLLDVLAPGADRVEPPCPLASRCGGCDWMHIGPDARARWQTRTVMRTLEGALGKHGVVLPEPEHHRVGADLGYRTRSRLQVQGSGRRAVVGFRAARSHDLVATASCPVLAPELAPILQELADWLATSSGRGEAQVALGRARRRVVELRWSGDLAAGFFRALEVAVGSGSLAGARVWLEGSREPMVVGDPRPVVIGVDGQPLLVAPGGFSQSSDAAGDRLARRVAELADARRPEKAIELFAGSGTLTVALAARAGELTAVERDEEAVAALRENLRARGLGVRVREADADALALPRVDLVVLDPPRGGAAGAVAKLVEARPKRVIYVSCNPQTLARDLVPLTHARYRIDTIDVVDVFPQTRHVETIVSLSR